MQKVISTEKIPIKLWLDDIEIGALEQTKNIANLPFVYKWVSIMPDSHQGYGMPIGGVMATKDVIVPNSVGVDIGCGMVSVKTCLTDIENDVLKQIMRDVRTSIPTGFNKHSGDQDDCFMPKPDRSMSFTGDKTPDYRDYPICNREYINALKSIGTLGGGNHFIEIQRGDDGFIYIMIHSGSRNLGYKVADHYNKVAIGLNEKWHSSITKDKQLAFLPVDSCEGQSYIREMDYCVKFAYANRKLMMDRILEILSDKFNDLTYEQMVNIAHNYARLENHYNKNVWVHRKGATSAKLNEVGIIPGSQGTKSYIVRGLGNKESFMSCSHGAGRLMSRTKAIDNLDLTGEIRRLDDLGVIHGIRNKSDLDEAPSAYKDIDIVMENQRDLVETVMGLTPLAVIKG